MSMSDKLMGGVTALFIGSAVIGTVGALPYYVYGTGESVTIKVNDKDRITTGSGKNVSSKYLVFVDGETFENTDSWLRLKFNSSDVQGKLKEGETYQCDVYGWRVPLLSWYRNIVDCQPATAPK